MNTNDFNPETTPESTSSDNNNSAKVFFHNPSIAIPIYPPPKKKHSTLSIVAFVLSVTICMYVLGAVFAIVDLALHKKEEKHSLSIAALIISVIWLIIGIIVAVFASQISSNDIKHFFSNSNYTSSQNNSTDSSSYDDSSATPYDDSEYDTEDSFAADTRLYNDALTNGNVYTQNQPFENNSLEVVMTEFGNYTKTEDIKPTPGYKYYYAKVTYNNQGSSSAYIDAFDFECFADGVYCTHATDVSDTDFSGSLDSNYTYDATIVFEIPQDTKKVDFAYRYYDESCNDNTVIFSTGTAS